MTKVLKKIFLGSYKDANDLNFLTRSKISHILCAAGELKTVFPLRFKYHKIWVGDVPSSNMTRTFEKAHSFIEEGLQGGTGVLIHCFAGVSRSTTILISYLIKYRKMSYAQALTLVRRRRPIVNPNEGFVKQLRYYEKQINQKKFRNRFFGGESGLS